jgi:hypothetical protein
MKTQTLLLFAAAFVAVSLAPQAMAQSCNAMHADFGSWFQTPNGRWTYGISFNADKGVDSAYSGNSEGAAGDSALKTPAPRLRVEPYMTSTFSRAPLKPVQAEYTSWCVFQCMWRGGNLDDCIFYCKGTVVQ